MRTFLLVGVALLLTASLAPSAAALPNQRDPGYLACLQVEPVVDNVVVQLGGLVPVSIVKTVVLSSGINCTFASGGGGCPFFTGTPLGTVYHLRNVGVGFAYDCVVVSGGPLGFVAQQANVRYLGGSCFAYAGANAAGVGASTPVVHWYCL